MSLSARKPYYVKSSANSSKSSFFFFFSPAFWLYNCLCFEQTKESAMRTSPLEPDTRGPFRPHPRSFLLLLNYSLLLKSDVESSFLYHFPPKNIAYNLSHPSLVLLLSAQDPETPPNLMASLDLWCLPSHHYSDSDNNRKFCWSHRNWLDLQCSRWPWSVRPQVTEKLSFSNKPLEAFYAEASQSCYLMADVFFVTQLLQDGNKYHIRRHLEVWCIRLDCTSKSY